MNTIPAMIGVCDFAIAESPALAAGEIHLWLKRVDPATPPREITSLARKALLDLLRRYGGEDTAPMIKYGEHGKPHVEEAGFPYFNLSHSGQCIVLAFSRDQELGVDVERESVHRRHSPLELAKRFFTLEESSALAMLDESRLNTAFMQLWTCKEAVLKALGHGLSFGLDRLHFRIGVDGVPDSLHSIAEDAGPPEEWQIHRFTPTVDYLGSLAWRGPQRLIRSFKLETAAASA